VALDLAGRGESGTGRLHWTMRASDEDVVSVVEQLGLRDVVPQRIDTDLASPVTDHPKSPSAVAGHGLASGRDG
jgi:hypothetical protein